jgi:hypothetical protein
MPITAFIGVRISWLMLARKIDFMAVASSATSLAACNSSSARLRASMFRQLPTHMRIEPFASRMGIPRAKYQW